MVYLIFFPVFSLPFLPLSSANISLHEFSVKDVVRSSNKDANPGMSALWASNPMLYSSTQITDLAIIPTIVSENVVGLSMAIQKYVACLT